MKNFLIKIWMRLCLNPFFTRRMKMLTGPDGFKLCRKLSLLCDDNESIEISR